MSFISTPCKASSNSLRAQSRSWLCVTFITESRLHNSSALSSTLSRNTFLLPSSLSLNLSLICLVTLYSLDHKSSIACAVRSPYTRSYSASNSVANSCPTSTRKSPRSGKGVKKKVKPKRLATSLTSGYSDLSNIVPILNACADTRLG